MESLIKVCDNFPNIRTAHGVKPLAPCTFCCFLLMAVVCLVLWFAAGRHLVAFPVWGFGLHLAGLWCGWQLWPQGLLGVGEGHCVRPARPEPPCPACRPVHQRGPVQAGEHAGELPARQLAPDWDHHAARQLPPAAPALLSPQHQHGLPAKRPFSLPGT